MKKVTRVKKKALRLKNRHLRNISNLGECEIRKGIFVFDLNLLSKFDEKDLLDMLEIV
jgi:hypothetical protein